MRWWREGETLVIWFDNGERIEFAGDDRDMVETLVRGGWDMVRAVNAILRLLAIPDEEFDRQPGQYDIDANHALALEAGMRDS